MRYRLKIEVNLKPGHSDPEGDATRDLLKDLGYKVKAVSVGKEYTVILDASSKKEAQTQADEMCKRLLANPTKDNYTVKLEEEE